MAHYHFVVEHSALCLPTIDNHRLFEYCSNMILTGTGRKSSRLALTHTSFIRIELKKHVSALTHLSLLIEHETATENIDLVLEAY